MKQGIIEQPTNKKPLEMKEDLKATKDFKPNQEESDKLKFIKTRFVKMRSKRQGISRNWQTYQTQFEAKYYPYKDGRSRSNVPLEWAIVELFVSEARQRKSQMFIEPIGMTDVDKVELLKRVKDYDWNRHRRDREIYFSEYQTAIYGSCVYFTGFEEKGRIIRDILFDKEGKEFFQKKLLKESKVVLKTVDIRNFYIDDRVNDQNDANDQIYIQYITTQEFESLKFDDNYIKNNLKMVSVDNKVEQDFFTIEERVSLNSGLVELMHYFNKQSDEYIVIANRKVIIRSQPLPYAHKKLPFTVRQYSYNPFSVYGRGLCEALTNFKSQLNDLKEMIMDGIKRSNNSMFLIGNGLSFDGNTFNFDNNIKKFQGNLNDSTYREIKGQQPNAAIFNYTEQILKDIAIFVGIDPSSIVGQPSSTAFETAVRQESSLKRVNVVLDNRDIALQEVFTQYLQLIMQYFPVKKARATLEIKGDKVEEEKIESPVILLKDEKIVTGKKGKIELVKAEGRFPFEVKPEYIRGQFDIEVKTDFNKPSMKELEKDNMTQFINNTANLLSLVKEIPEMEEVIKPKEFIKDMADKFSINIDAIGGIEGSLEKEKQKLFNLLKQVTGTEELIGPAGTVEGGEEEAGGQDLIPRVSGTPAGQTVRTPKVPTIKQTSPGIKAIAG